MKFTRVMILALGLALGGGLLPAAAAAAGPAPQDFLQKNLDEFVALLKDPGYQAKEAERTRAIWEIINRVFDFEGISMRAVGRDWKRFTPPEQAEFSKAFAELLGESYLKKIQDGYRDEKVELTNTQMLDERKAMIKSRIVRQAGDVAVDYSLWDRGAGWRIYDVNVEGVSLVKNYRDQFGSILMKETPAQLIERVKQKVKDQREGKAS